MDEDSRLIRAMRAGSDEAIESFVRKYYPQIYSYCLRLHLLSRAVFEALPLRDAGRGAVPALDYALV